MEKILKEFLKKYLLTGKRIGVAVSGGIDSMCLLEALSSLNVELYCLHFEHGIRAESMDDALFVRAAAERLGVVFMMSSENIPRLAKESGKGIELLARERRYHFFDCATEKYELDAIFTAHHADDFAESVILNMIRGSGGAVGIEEYRQPNIYRPFLTASRAEIVRYAQENNIAYRIDVTNEDIAYTRNFVRHRIVPEMKRMNPNLNAALYRAACIENDRTDFIDSLADKLISENGLDVKALNGCHIALKRQTVRRYIEREFSLTDISFANIEDVCDLVKTAINGKQIELSGGLDAKIEDGRLVICSRAKTFIKSSYIDVAIDTTNDTIIKSDDFIFTIKRAAHADFEHKSRYEEYADLSYFHTLSLRNRRDGDFIYPLGMSGKKSLSDYLCDKKIKDRDGLKLLASGSEVLAVMGIGISNRIALKDGCQIYHIRLESGVL